MRIVETAIANARLTISVLLFLMLAGTLAYISIPKEAEPDIQIPILYVSMHYDGISPEDSERLLLRPMETAIKSITGIKKMTSTAYQNGGYVLLEFQAGADLKKALDDVRNKVDMARPESASSCSHARTAARLRVPMYAAPGMKCSTLSRSACVKGSPKSFRNLAEIRSASRASRASR